MRVRWYRKAGPQVIAGFAIGCGSGFVVAMAVARASDASQMLPGPLDAVQSVPEPVAYVIVAALVSSLLSLRFLAGPRDRFAQSVQARAERASARLEEMRSREDVD